MYFSRDFTEFKMREVVWKIGKGLQNFQSWWENSEILARKNEYMSIM